MSGHRPFSELTRNFAPKRRRRIDDMKAELLAEMPLHELRRARAGNAPLSGGGLG